MVKLLRKRRLELQDVLVLLVYLVIRKERRGRADSYIVWQNHSCCPAPVLV